MKRLPGVNRGWAYVAGATVGLLAMEIHKSFPQHWQFYVAYVAFTIFVMWLLDD